LIQRIERELWEVSVVGFCLQDLGHQFGFFLEGLLRPYHYLQVGTVLEERGRLGDSVILRSDLETYLRGS
jgi:hypothetical protein